MKNKLDMALGGIELLVAIGVSTLVGGAVTLVKPTNLGAIKKIAVGLGGTAISCMAVDEVTDYVDKQFNLIVKQIKESTLKTKNKKTEEEEEA